jgi:hypothetical protein
MHRTILLQRMALAALMLFGLNQSVTAQSDPSAPPAMPDLQAAMQQLGALMGGTNAAATVVGFRQLMAHLPADLPGFTRAKPTGEKSGAFGITVSTTEAVYSGPDGAEIRIKLADMGGMGGMMAFAQMDWTMTEVDRETEEGYERTYTYKGNKAYEKYSESDKSGEFQTIVNKKFSVEITGSNVGVDAITAARDKLDLAAIGQLQPETAPAE